jgi:hypothetical protein
MQPGITVGVATNIEQVLLLDDDFNEKRDLRKKVPMDEVFESIRELALAILSKHVLCRPDQFSLTSYVDDSSCWFVSSLPALFARCLRIEISTYNNDKE